MPCGEKNLPVSSPNDSCPNLATSLPFVSIILTLGPRSVPVSLVPNPQKYSPMYMRSLPWLESKHIAAALEKLPHCVWKFPFLSNTCIL